VFGFLSWFRSSGLGDATEFAPDVCAVLQRAHEQAVRLRSSAVGTEHILLAILGVPQSEASLALSAVGLRSTELRAHLETRLGQEAASGGRHRRGSSRSASWSAKAKGAIVAAVGEARKLNQRPVSSGHLLLALLKDTDSIASKALADRGIRAADVRTVLQEGVGTTADLDIRLDDQSDRLIYQQIVAQIQEAIATGRLLPSQRLPPIRQLADQLEVAPGTVARAYAQLEAAGTVVTGRARGTFVAGPTETAANAQGSQIRDLLRPTVVAAFHLGLSADELRAALADAMADIYPGAQ
jgi:DNA-binding transcriptional regulator YhcF (GntR family)